jgi:hypothetical protein
MLRGPDRDLSRLLERVSADPYCHRCRWHDEVDLWNLFRVAGAPDRPFRLENLLAGVIPEHRHGEVDWGQPVGRDVW